jgi:hypothetical protein
LYFITDVKIRKVGFGKLYVLLSEKKFSLLQNILPSLEACAPSGWEYSSQPVSVSDGDAAPFKTVFHHSQMTARKA